MFLRGKIVTQLAVGALSLLELLMCVYFIIILVNRYLFPDTFTKVVFIAAMTVHGLAVMQCLATSHAIALRAKQLSFKRWFLLLLIATFYASRGLDMWYFGLIVTRRGYQRGCVAPVENNAGDKCSARYALVGLTVLLFVVAIYRLVSVLIVWHWDVKWNQASTEAAPVPPAPVTASSTSATPAAHTASKLNSLSKSVTPFRTKAEQKDVGLGLAESRPLRASDFDVSSDSEGDSSDSESTQRERSSNRL